VRFAYCVNTIPSSSTFDCDHDCCALGVLVLLPKSTRPKLSLLLLRLRCPRRREDTKDGEGRELMGWTGESV
jgi:hypothetical protein